MTSPDPTPGNRAVGWTCLAALAFAVLVVALCACVAVWAAWPG